ncbi:alpha/beta fold hydrolase [Actinoplanes sp. NPDC049265]|uniref:S9 family peptidase n=1 Tax=Actinoplanes sp. NPDC049265 TaxID=3363902 RepID=UPI0037234D75
MVPFADLDAYVALPRVDGLWLAPDGSRLVVGVATPDRKNTRYLTALWEIDPEGRRPARRLTRSSEGEAAAAFTPDGDLLFVSKRPDPDAEEGAEARPALWVQPRDGGDARVLVTPPHGVRGPRTGADGTVLFGTGLMPSAPDAPADQELRERRKDGGVSAVLHDAFPARYWDHDLGPDRTRLVVTGAGGELRDLTGHVGPALDDAADWDLSPDGRTVVTTWTARVAGERHVSLVAIDVATGERRTLAADPRLTYDSPRVSPDGSRVAMVVWRRSTPQASQTGWLAIVPLAGGPVRDLTRDWDRWPHPGRWTPDGAALVISADDQGRSPLWRVDVESGEVARLTDDDGAYTDVRVAPDGRWAYALRSAIDGQPRPVRVSLTGAGVEELPSPAAAIELPGRLTEITTTAEDGTPLRAWLALPHHAGAASPVPMLLWIHGGPRHSWNSWSWRWNPWIAVADGYAVLMPDPALSTGYGYHFMERGWGSWGGKPYTDLMTVTDATIARDDVDESRIAVMGGSFGGYMANWIAGHTDRFAAIVTHASLWALDQFGATTDTADVWSRELPPVAAAASSPHGFADSIRTPMLVIHGDRDHRVPISEALRLWWDLQSRSGAEPSPHRFLYFPDETHWITKPGNAKVWYETVLAFLAHHVRGEKWQPPELLG